MIRTTLGILSLLFSLGANATIFSLDSTFGVNTITRDTQTGLDWLDVTASQGLSYDQVKAQMESGGAFVGWRYASVTELDQLLDNMGYTVLFPGCFYGEGHCDFGGEQEVTETIIRTLGDTFDASLDQTNDPLNIAADGAGETRGLLDGPHQ